MSKFWIDSVDGDTVTTVNAADKRDIQLVADHCAALRSAGRTGTKDEKLAMSVPGWVMDTWCVKKGVQFRDLMRDKRLQDRFIMDPDNAAFRVWEGRL